MRFLRTLLVSLAVCAAAYLLAALYIDPGYEFLQRDRQPLDANKGEICRLQKLVLVQRYAALGHGHIDGLILGSSRVMKLPPTAFTTHGRVFNFGVPNAKNPDNLAAYRYVKSRFGAPHYLLIGLDVAAFNPIDYGPTEELRAIKPLYTMIEQPKTFHDQLNTAQRVYSINYALQMARTLPALLRHADPAAAIPLRSAEYGYDPDGLIQYYDRDRTVAAGTYDWEKQYTDRLSVYLDVFKGMHGLAPEAKASLETLLAEAMADHARVHLWITAFQPTADATLSKETTYPQRLAELRTYLTDVARRYRVHLSDVLDGRRYGDPRQNWYDSVHPSPPGAARLAALLQEDERGL